MRGNVVLFVVLAAALCVAAVSTTASAEARVSVHTMQSVKAELLASHARVFQLFREFHAVAARELNVEQSTNRTNTSTNTSTTSPTRPPPPPPTPTKSSPTSGGGGVVFPSNGTGGNVSLDDCKSAQASSLLYMAYTACTSDSSVFFGNHAADSYASVARAYCNGTCWNLIQKNITGTKFARCFPPQHAVGQIIVSSTAMCTPSPTGKDCALYTLQVRAMLRRCQGYWGDSCKNVTGCYWDASLRQCLPAPTQANVEVLCNDCVDQLLRVQNEGGLVMFKQIYCVKDGSKFCAPQVISVTSNSQVTTETAAQFDALCNGTMRTCTHKILNAFADMARRTALTGFQNCVLTTRSKTGAAGSLSTCVQSFQSASQSAGAYNALASHVCKKNGAGLNCYVGAMRLTAAVTAAAVRCNDTARSAIGAALDALGCCAGLLDEVYQAAPLRPMDVPAGSTLPVTNAPAPLPTAPNGTAGAAGNSTGASDATEDREEKRPGMLEGWVANVCPVPGLSARFAKRCVVKRVAAAKKNMRLPLLWKVLNATAGLLAKIEDGIASDIAVNAGVPRSAVNVTVTEDKTLKVAVDSPQRRTLRVAQTTTTTTASTESGINAEVRIATTSDADQAQAVASIDDAIKTNSVTLSSTVALISAECTTCVGSGGVSALGNTGSLSVAAIETPAPPPPVPASPPVGNSPLNDLLNRTKSGAALAPLTLTAALVTLVVSFASLIV